MGKYATLLIGLALMAVGCWGIRAFWPSLKLVLQAALPVAALCIGFFAFMIGLAEIWDTLSSKRSGDAPPQ
jgi:hypothetical protein